MNWLANTNETEDNFRSGFIGIIGRPNAGKSTLINLLVGEKVAIATPKPQTTRNRITGIRNLPPPRAGQLVLVDTPGIHRSRGPLNEKMMTCVDETIKGADLLLFLIDASCGRDERNKEIAASLPPHLPVILVFNKIDLLSRPLEAEIREEFKRFPSLREILAVSAKTGEGTDELLTAIWSLLPSGPALFPEDMFTDQTERFLAAEMVREKIILLTREEIPYASAVCVEAFQEDEKRNFIRISALIQVEKESQKRIIIGQGGRMIKEIGQQARIDLESFFAAKIYLELFVRVKKDWTGKAAELKKMGYK